MAFPNSLKPEHWIALVAASAALLTLIKGLMEFRRAQQWKKAEFLAQEIKSFRQDVDVKRALLMLDWSEIPIYTAEHEGLTKREIICDDELLFMALTPDDDTDFSDNQYIVRIIFDQYLDKLSMFERYVQSGLVKVDELRPYLQYWIDAMCNKVDGRKTPEIIDQLWAFISRYQYTSVIKLCEEFGYREMKR
jgi:hypothetical protein